jgi:hypothetical protein
VFILFHIGQNNDVQPVPQYPITKRQHPPLNFKSGKGKSKGNPTTPLLTLG